MAGVKEPTFGSILQGLRQAAGLSQEELADRAQLSKEAISALERGVRRWPYANTIDRLAAALDLRPEDRARLERAAGRRRAAGRDPAARDEATIDRPADARSGGPAPLIGRQRECAWLEGELHAGHPLVLLGGEPGIGKTRLLREATGWARRHGWYVLAGDCRPSSRQEPYAPIVEALERHVRSLPADVRRVDLEEYAWLGCLLPELVDPAALAALLRTARPEHEQRLLFAAVERYLSEVAARAGRAGRSGTLLVLDDLQWVGPDALQLTARLLQRTGASRIRIRILGAYRSNEVAPGHPLSALVADLARDDLVARLELATLGWADATALARALLPAPPRDAGGGDEAGRVVARLVARTGGVPYFLVSYARWLQSPDQGPRRPGPGADAESAARAPAPDRPLARLEAGEGLPWDLAQSIRERVAALPEVAQELLAVAAVMGRPVAGSLLAAAAERTEAEALPALEAACHAGLLVEDPEADGPGRFRCAHDLVGEAVERDLLAWRRTQLHRKAALAYERTLPGQGAPAGAAERPLTQLAYHYARADMPEKAIVYLRLAGDQARNMYAHGDAAAYYRELVAFLDRLGQGREAAQARGDLAIALTRAGRMTEALETLEQAERFYLAVGDVEAITQVTMAIGHVHAGMASYGMGLERVQALVQSLMGETGDGGPEAPSPRLPAAVGAQLLGSLAEAALIAGKYRDGLAAAERAVAVAATTGDGGLLARQQLQLGTALHTVGRTAEAVDALERAIAGATAAGDLQTRSEALRIVSWTYQTRGEFEESRRVQGPALEAAARVGDQVGLGLAMFFDALLAYYLGDWTRALGIAASAGGVFEQLELVLLSSYPPMGLGWLYLLQGRREEGERCLAEARKKAEQTGELQVLRLIDELLAERDLLMGESVAARDRLDALLFGDRQLQERTRVELVVLRGWAAVQLGDEARAVELVEDGVRSARVHQLGLVLPDALRVRALWAMRRRRWQAAEAALEEALALCRAMAYPYPEAKTLYVWGQLEVARGEPARAHKRFERALAILAGLGERLYAEHIEGALATLGR